MRFASSRAEACPQLQLQHLPMWQSSMTSFSGRLGKAMLAQTGLTASIEGLDFPTFRNLTAPQSMKRKVNLSKQSPVSCG
jgi:hypothetical protein